MQAFQQEVLRVVLLDTRLRRITAVDVTKGTLNESLGHPREVFRAAIVHSAYALAIVHNHPSGIRLRVKRIVVSLAGSWNVQASCKFRCWIT